MWITCRHKHFPTGCPHLVPRVVPRVIHRRGRALPGLKSPGARRLPTRGALTCGHQPLPPPGGPHDSYPLIPCGRLCCARHSLDSGSAGDRSCCRGDERDLPGRLGPGLGDPVGPSATYQVGKGSWPAPWVPSPLRGFGRLSCGGLDTPVSGPPSLCLLTGAFWSRCVPVRVGGVTRLPGVASL